MNHAGLIEYAVIGIFMALMVVTALVFRRFSANVSDYFRAGCRGTWWLVGASTFMASFSAWTFTGAAGVAYSCGWSVLIIFVANVAGYLVHVAFLAPRFRQLRALSVPEVIRLRFGVPTQQLYAWSSVLNILYSCLHLYGVSIFTSAVFGFRIETVIVVIGVVVLFYSFLGGSWGVMANDFLQGLILMPMTILIALLCLQYAGGFGTILTEIKSQNLSEQFKLIKDSSFTTDSIDFTMFWAVAIFANTLLGYISLGSSGRYFGVKDGREARKAAAFAGSLQMLGVLIWFIPPITARLFFPGAVNQVNISNPAEAAYAIAGLKLLPLGMAGLMVVAIFSATMSSMDSGLNGCSAVFINDIYPALCRLFRRRPWEGRRLFLLAQTWTVMMGGTIVIITLYMARLKGTGIFKLMLDVGAVIGIPMSVPLVMGLIIRRSPSWAALVSIGCAAFSSLAGFAAGSSWLAGIPLLDSPWKWHTRVAVTFAFGITAYLATLPFWKTSSTAYLNQVEEFFRRMGTPVNFALEVGEANDSRQLRVIGNFCMVIGGMISLLLLLPNPWGLNGRLGIALVSGFGIGIGLLMNYLSRRHDAAARKVASPTVEPEPAIGDVDSAA